MRFQKTIDWSSDDIFKDAVLKFEPLIRIIANEFRRRLCGYVDIDDLIQAGNIGLIDAVTKFTPNQKLEFKSYAEIKIRRAMLEELRLASDTTEFQRSAGISGKKVALTNEDDLTIRDRKVLGDLISEKAIGPEMNLQNKRISKDISNEMATLSEKSQRAVYLYFYTDLRLKEIADLLVISESTIQKLLKRTLARLKKTKLKKYKGGI